MAKKHKKEKEPEEKYEFVPPEFDEKQFLKDEMNATKRVVLVVLYGVLFGVIAAIATAMTRNGYFGFLIFIVGALMIKYFLIAAKLDLSKFTKKNWAENAVWFFFTFLAIWILVVNPPFFDYVAPEIKNIRLTIEAQDGKLIVYNYSKDAQAWQTSKGNMSVASAMLYAYTNHTSVNISAQIADSSGLNGKPVITIAPNTATIAEMSTAGDSKYYYLISGMGPGFLNKGEFFTFSISAGDMHSNQVNFNLPASAEIVVG